MVDLQQLSATLNSITCPFDHQQQSAQMLHADASRSSGICCKCLQQYTFHVTCVICRGLTAERSKEAGMEWRESETSQAALKLAIEQVLRLIYEEHYEVPFISSYRKEVYMSCMLSISMLLPM